MGWDHDLICVDCQEGLCIARNKHLYRQPEALDELEAFLEKHADHALIYEADDNWSRCPDARPFDSGTARPNREYGLSAGAVAAVEEVERLNAEKEQP